MDSNEDFPSDKAQPPGERWNSEACVEARDAEILKHTAYTYDVGSSVHWKCS